MEKYVILAINPGSTTTKLAVFDNENEVFTTTVSHSTEDINKFKRVADQFEFRKNIILDTLISEGIKLDKISAVIGRGGLVRPIPSGVYRVDDALKADLINPPQGEHASNLGGLLAAEIAKMIGVEAFIADPVVVDEMSEVAHISGSSLFRRKSIFHALNQKAVARAYAKSVGKCYEELNLIVAHLGGGVSVGAHCKGRVVDVNNALDGDGPFSPERAGTLPAGQLAEACFSGKYTHTEIKRMLCGKGGVVSLCGTNDIREVLRRKDSGETQAALVIEAMIYNIAKYIGSMSAVLRGQVDAIIITGGIAHSELICNGIKDMIGFIAPVTIIAGEDEMAALAHNALSVLRGETTALNY